MNLLNCHLQASDKWFGFQRHIFDFEGHEAWIVEPETPAPGNPWTWCMEWPSAFVERTGVPELLKQGFHHVYIKVSGYACDEALKVYRRFHSFLQTSGLAKKARLVGLSFGGLYSLRYASENPELIAGIYLDAPVCNFKNFFHFDLIKEPYNIQSEKDVELDPRLPVNLTKKLSGIPILLIYGTDDLVVPPVDNCELFASRFRAHGGSIKIIKRNLWGHHPHGLDDTTPIIEFINSCQDA